MKFALNGALTIGTLDVQMLRLEKKWVKKIFLSLAKQSKRLKNFA